MKKIIVHPASGDEKSIGLWIYSAGHTEWGRKQDIENRVRNDHQIVYLTEGKGAFVQDGTLYQVKKGDVFIVFPGLSHSYHSDRKIGWEAWWVHVRGDWVTRMMSFCDFKPTVPVRSIGAVPRLLESFHYILENGGEPEPMKTAGLTEALFSLFCSLYPMSKQAEDSEIQRALNYVNRRFRERITLDELAAVAGISKYYFVRRFKASFGKSPMNYIIDLKMTEAKRLLAGGPRTIKEIAQHIGYEPPYFACLFKKNTGSSPREYRRLHGEFTTD